MSEWPTVTLEDIADHTRRPFAMGPFGSRIRKEFYRDSGIPVIRGGNLQGERFVNEEYVFLSDEKAEELSSSVANAGDIVFVAQGGIGQVGLVPENTGHDRFILSQNLMRVTVDPEKADAGYVFYYFRSNQGQYEILSYANPTGVPCISRPLTSLKSFRIPLPPLGIQRQIAHILGTLDDKIELNRRMNRTLEAIAWAIFKSWFVDFDPVHAKAEGREPAGMDPETATLFPDGFQDSPLGKIPKGWKVTDIGSVCEVLNGGTPSTKVDEYWHPGDMAWATPTDITALDSPIIRATARRISQQGLENSSAKLLPPGSVLVTSRATIGFSAVSSVPIATNQGFKSLVCKEPVTSLFMLQVVRMLQREFINLASGSTYPEINAATFKRIRFVLPSKDLILAFEATAARLFAKIEANDTEIESLGHTRDSLLPNLLSGWLEVANA